MSSRELSRRKFLQLVSVSGAAAFLGACAPKVVKETVEVEKVVTQIVKEVVKETIVVEGKPKEVTKIVEKVVTSTPAPEARKVITYLETAGFGVPQYSETIDPIAEALSKKMQAEGLNLEFKVLVLDDPRNEYPMLAAGGADFTWSFDGQWYHMLDFLAQGYFRPIEALLPEYGPNIIKAIGQDLINTNYMKGHLYGLPTGFALSCEAGGLYRLDLAEKYGMGRLHNLDELEAFLYEVKKNEPDMIPFASDSNWTAAGMPGPWHGYVPPRTGLDLPGDIPGKAGLAMDDIIEGRLNYVDGESKARSRAGYERCRLWMEEGLVNRNMLQLQTLSADEELFCPGRAAAMCFTEPVIKAELLFQPKLESYVPGAKAAGFESSMWRDGADIKWARFVVWNFQCFNANMALEDTIAGLKFFDWLLADQDNIDIWLFGIDGVNYTKLPNMRYRDIPGIDGTTNYRRRWYIAGVPGKFERVPESASDEYLFTEVMQF